MSRIRDSIASLYTTAAKIGPLVAKLDPLVRQAWPLVAAIVAILADRYGATGGAATPLTLGALGAAAARNRSLAIVAGAAAPLRPLDDGVREVPVFEFHAEEGSGRHRAVAVSLHGRKYDLTGGPVLYFDATTATPAWTAEDQAKWTADAPGATPPMEIAPWDPDAADGLVLRSVTGIYCNGQWIDPARPLFVGLPGDGANDRSESSGLLMTQGATFPPARDGSDAAYMAIDDDAPTVDYLDPDDLDVFAADDEDDEDLDAEDFDYDDDDDDEDDGCHDDESELIHQASTDEFRTLDERAIAGIPPLGGDVEVEHVKASVYRAAANARPR